MVLQTITPWSWEKPVSLSLRAEQNGQLTRDQRGRPAVAPVAISQQTEDSFALRPAVTVDQPPLAVGVRFPLCPPIFREPASARPLDARGLYRFFVREAPAVV